MQKIEEITFVNVKAQLIIIRNRKRKIGRKKNIINPKEITFSEFNRNIVFEFNEKKLFIFRFICFKIKNTILFPSKTNRFFFVLCI